MTWVAQLRRQGLRVDWDVSSSRSVKAQFKAANRTEAAAVAVVGAEWAEGLVTMKDLGTGEQHQVSIEEVVEWTKQH
jgi:histidyl-tRNA synthetase